MKYANNLGGRGPLLLMIAGSVLFLSLQVHRLAQKSVGFDELAYIGQGQLHLRAGHFELSRQRHPPLAKYISAFPLLWSDIALPSIAGQNAYLFGFNYLYRNTMPAAYILLTSRLPMLFLTLLLVWMLYYWAVCIGNPWGGALSALFLIFDPNVMAHSGLVMTDICLAAMLFCTSFFIWNFTLNNDRKSIFFAGVFYGAALLSKITALMALPVFALLFFSVSSRSQITNSIKAFIWIIGIALGVVAVGYRIVEIRFWFYEIFDRFFESSGLATIVSGETLLTGSTYHNALFYLKKCFYKSSIPFLLGTGWALFSVAHSPRPVKILFLGMAFIFLGSTLINDIQSAVRYILPAFPFLILPLIFNSKRWARYCLCVLASLNLVVTLRAHPNYLPYTNAFYRQESLPIFTGSEYDFGLDLPALAKFMNQRPSSSVILCYFGFGDPASYGLSAQLLPGYPVYMQEVSPIINSINPQSEFLAVSVNSLLGHKDKDLLTEISKKNPVAKLGETIWVWDITRDIETHKMLEAWYKRYEWTLHVERQQKRILFLQAHENAG